MWFFSFSCHNIHENPTGQTRHIQPEQNAGNRQIFPLIRNVLLTVSFVPLLVYAGEADEGLAGQRCGYRAPAWSSWYFCWFLSADNRNKESHGMAPGAKTGSDGLQQVSLAVHKGSRRCLIRLAIGQKSNEFAMLANTPQNIKRKSDKPHQTITLAIGTARRAGFTQH